MAISGSVRDPSDAAIVGAQVTLIGPDQITVYEVMTDARGAFRIEQLEPGDYRLEVQKEGFRKTVITMALGAKAILPLRIVLPILVANQEISVPSVGSAGQTGTAKPLTVYPSSIRIMSPHFRGFSTTAQSALME